MKSLFGRILLSFWMMLIMIALIGNLIFGQAYQWYYQRAVAEQSQTLNTLRDGIETALKQDDIDTAKALLLAQPSHIRNQVRVYDYYNYEILDRYQQPFRPWHIAPHNARAKVEQVNIEGRWGEYYQLLITHEPYLPVWLGNDAVGFAIRLLITLLVSFFASWLLAYSITRRLSHIQRIAQQVAQGDYALKIKENGQYKDDEIDQLAHNIDIMTTTLANNIQDQQSLLQNIAHEIRAPLARQRIIVELLARERDNPDKISDFSQRLDSDIARLDELTTHALTLFRQQSLRQLNLQDMALKTLLKPIIDNAQFEFAQLNITQDIADIHLKVDSALFASAVENIIRNAGAYAATQIHISASVAGNHCRLEIADDGKGVSDTALDNIFKPFTRAENARTPKASGGYGLGLAISKAAIVNHGGTISAENSQSGGLKVVILLPYHSEKID